MFKELNSKECEVARSDVQRSFRHELAKIWLYMPITSIKRQNSITNDICSFIGLLLCDHKWWSQSDDIAMCWLC